jgi:apolipoprotein N-acyltransferase
MIRTLAQRLLEAAGLALLFLLAFRSPAGSGHGYLEAAAALVFPALLFRAVFAGRGLGWIFLALFLAFLGLFHWVPRTVSLMGGLPPALGLVSGILLMAWEALGLLAVTACSRWARGRGGALAAALAAALGLLLWESYGFHIYPWSQGAALGGLPWLARGAAFIGAQGLAALLWAGGAYAGARFQAGDRSAPLLLGPGAALAVLLGLAGLWPLLPRGPQRDLDLVVIQPNFESGLRRPGMEEDMWRRSDTELRHLGLPHPGTATLLLWPESSVLGRDDRQPSARLRAEAERRGIGWLYGTEGGLLNLARGEAAGQPSFLQGKIEPMPFGERMPGPPFLRHWLDRNLGFISQEPGQLSAASSFRLPTPQGPLRVHPLLCSEALDPARVRHGLAEAGGELLVNLTNDGWFEHSIATDLHAAQIRMRAVEAGLPLVRATLTGKSGLFREDGRWSLWGEPMTEAAYSFHLRWRPISTPARSAGFRAALLLLLTAMTAAAVRARPFRP